jgi:hypothetical protein
MSFQAMTWAIEQPCTSAGQKLVLLMLANHSNGHTGQCNPSHKLLAQECAMGVSTLKGHLLDLQSAGYLTIIHKSMEGVSLPNQYKLNGVGQNLTEGRSEADRGVGQNLATKQEVQPVKETINTVPDFVNAEVWRDFIKLRNAKKSPITQTALRGIEREAKKAGIDLQQALEVCCERGWASFKAEWMNKDQPKYQPAQLSAARAIFGDERGAYAALT